MGRLAKLPPYLFSEIDEARDRARAAGVDVIDLGIGDPDRPTPAPLLDRAAAALRDAAHHRYPSNRGLSALRHVIADYLVRRDGVTVDPRTQIQVLIGSKEGLAHLPLALVEEGDSVLVPDLGYPVYGQATLLAGGEPRAYGLSSERGFRPDLAELARLADGRTRAAFLNYPHNPTGATVDAGFWREAAQWARESGIVLVNDGAYLEVSLDDGRPASLLAAAEPDAPVIEFHSLSKTFNMTGWRIGFAVGHADVIDRLGRVKETMDSGVFGAVQEVAVAALGPDGEPIRRAVMAPYAERRRRLEEALAAAGFEVFPTAATFYLWIRVPGDGDSLTFCGRLLDETGVVATPGVGFGSGGEGWFRLSLTAPDERIAAAAERLRDWRSQGRGA